MNNCRCSLCDACLLTAAFLSWSDTRRASAHRNTWFCTQVQGPPPPSIYSVFSSVEVPSSIAKTHEADFRGSFLLFVNPYTSKAQHLGKFATIPQISFQFGKLVPAHMDFLGFKKFSNILTVSHSMTSQIYSELELSWYVNSIYVYKNNLQIVSFSCTFHTTRCLLLQVSVKETTICLMLFCCVFFCEAL